MFSSSLIALLSLGSIVNTIGSTPSPIPAPASDSIPASEGPTNDWFNTMTIYNDGGTHIINNETSSSKHEIITVTDNTTLRMEANGYIEAPENGYKSDTDWPAVRLSIGSILNATGGSVTGSLATRDDTDGGEAIEIYNGQSSPETASYAHFYDGINVIGGDAQANGAGGSAIHVHGFGTSVFIHGGNFQGGKGSDGDDGLSIYALNGGDVHIYSGSFEGEMEVGDSSMIAFYGCFVKNDTKVTGVFVDETNLEVNVMTRNGGKVMFISVSDQECETAPSSAPTNVPTLSPQPTVPRSNGGSKNGGSYAFITVAAFILGHLMAGAVS